MGPTETCLIVESSPNFGEMLQKHFMKYKIRVKVEIKEVTTQYQVWTVFGKHLLSDSSELRSKFLKTDDPSIFVMEDPRTPLLGFRIVAPVAYSCKLDWLKK